MLQVRERELVCPLRSGLIRGGFEKLADSGEELAQRLEKHELVFFRQISSQIYRKNKRWEKSIALSKQDKLFRDAIETAAMSGKTEVVEELLRYGRRVEAFALDMTAG